MQMTDGDDTAIEIITVIRTDMIPEAYAEDDPTAGKTIAVLGLTFKPNTDDMREAPSLEIVPRLQAAGARVRAFDPEGMDEARKLLEDVDWCDNAYDALAGAHAMVIVTEWNEFRALNLARVKGAMANPLMVDLRNIYDPEEMAAAGFDYTCIGRTTGR